MSSVFFICTRDTEKCGKLGGKGTGEEAGEEVRESVYGEDEVNGEDEEVKG